MFNNDQFSPPDIFKLFDFLDVETPAAVQWVHSYLANKGIWLPVEVQSIENIKNFLAKNILSFNKSNSELEMIARTMSSAWRIRKHRQKKNIGTLSLSLDKEVLNKFKEMCHKQKKTKVMSELINGGYGEFLKSKAAEKAELNKQKRIQEMARENMRFNLLLQKKPTQSIEELKAIKTLQTQNEQLKQNLATLYDLIYSANEQGSTIDDQYLLQATKLYYNTFNK